MSAIGHQGIFRLIGWSRQIHTGFLEPRATWETTTRVHTISSTGVPPSVPSHSRLFDYDADLSLRPGMSVPRKDAPTTPHLQRLTAITQIRFGLIRFRSPLLTESQLCSLPVGTEMFHFPTFPQPDLYIQPGVTGLTSSRVPPFGNPRITVWLSTPRGLSQIPTSFFGSWCQGIHRAPLKT